MEKVILREEEDGECYAEVNLKQGPRVTLTPPSPLKGEGRGEGALVQMRPSDGLSLAYRFKAPVFATDALMQRKVIPEGRKGKLTKEEVETLLYGKPLSDLLWTRLRDIALAKPLLVEATPPLVKGAGGIRRAEAHIRLVAEGSEKKAIVENAEKEGRKIAVEIKSFKGRSEVDDWENALGQYILYRNLLLRREPERTLYLAVPMSAYDGIFSTPLGRVVIEDEHLNLIVFDPTEEVIQKWIH